MLSFWSAQPAPSNPGDTFYPGSIYLFIPETDFAACRGAVKRPAALAPQLKLLLPGHSVPEADPVSLRRLSNAADLVKNGKVKAQVTWDHRE